MIWVARAVVAIAIAAASTGHAAPRVVDVVGATADVHDVLAIDDALLIGTSGGVTVVRDGRVAQTLGVADGLVGARVLSLSATDDGVWVGGVDGAALLERRGKAFGITRTLPIRRVTRVARFAGDTWFATHGSGLFRMSPMHDPVAVAIGRYRKRVSDLLVVGDRLWVATIDDGIVRLTADGHSDPVRGLASDVVWDLEPDGDRVLAATTAGVSVVSVLGKARPLAGLDKLAVRDIRSIAHRGSTTWVATFGAGAWRLDGDTPIQIDATPDTRVIALAPEGQSESARVIVGSERGATSNGEPLLAGGGLPSPDVTALASAFGALWIGTFSHGVARLRAGVVDAPSELSAVDPRVNDLAVTAERGRERLWIATDRGLWWYDGAKVGRELDARAPGDEHVTGLYVDPAGALWVASARMLARRDTSGWRAWTGDADAPLVHLDAVTSDAAGHIWAAGLHGIVELTPADGTIHLHSTASGALAVDWATSVIAWHGGIVVGTYNAGLSWYEGSFHQEPEGAGGVPAGWVNPHAMRAAGDDLWFGTLDRGLVVGHRGVWHRLRIADGLPSDDVTAVLPGGDHAMWIGTRGGLARVTF